MGKVVALKRVATLLLYVNPITIQTIEKGCYFMAA
jgi:hypothetical protein